MLFHVTALIVCRLTPQAVPHSPWRCPLSRRSTRKPFRTGWSSRPTWKRREQVRAKIHQVLQVASQMVRQCVALNTVPFAHRGDTFSNEGCADIICVWTAVLCRHPHDLWEGRERGRKSRHTRPFRGPHSHRLGAEGTLGDATLFLFVKQIKAVYYNDTPIRDLELHLFKGQRWSPDLFLNVTTDSEGMAVFSFCTDDEEGNIYIEVRKKTEQKQQPSSKKPRTCHSVAPCLNHLAHAVGFLLSLSRCPHRQQRNTPNTEHPKSKVWTTHCL